MKKHAYLLLLLFGLSSIMNFTMGFATTYYVAPNGSDSSSGTGPDRPFASIQMAADVVEPGDTVRVLSGTYLITEKALPYSNLLLHKSGTPTARIQYISDVPWGAKIRTVGLPTDNSIEIRGSYVDFIGFDVSGDGRIGIIQRGGNTEVNIIGNYVHDINTTSCHPDDGNTAIDGGSSTVQDSYVRIVGNVVENIGEPWRCDGISYQQSHGIYFGYGDGLIANNIVRNIHTTGIELYHGPRFWTVANNTVTNAEAGIQLWDSGEGFELNGGITNALIANNILVNNYIGFTTNVSGPNNRLFNNLIFGNTVNIYDTGGSIIRQNNIEVDPGFVDLSAGDVRLQSSSPAINSGIDLSSLFSTDFRGATRTLPFDIGAYEFNGVLPSPSPTPTPAPTPAPLPSPNPAPNATISLSSTQVAPGEIITVSVSGGASGTQEWVALYNAADPDSAWSVTDSLHPTGNWQYLNGTQTEPSSGLSSATLTFTAPTAPGTYNFRYFAQNGYQSLLAISSDIAVVPPLPAPTPGPAPLPTGYLPQSQMSVIGASYDVGGAGAVLDGNPDSRWLVESSSAQEIMIQLGGLYSVTKLLYSETWSRVGHFEVYVSENGVNWGTPVASGDMPDTGEIPLSGKNGSYVKFVGNPGNGFYFYIGEINVAGVGALPAPSPQPSPEADQVLPTVAIFSPTDGTFVPRRSSARIQASANDNVEVDRVEFLINGSLACTDTTSPYECEFKTGARGKRYRLKAVAYDRAGNTGSSTIVRVRAR